MLYWIIPLVALLLIGLFVMSIYNGLVSRRNEAKLSINRLHQDEERRAHKEYRQKLKAEANFGTLGDLLKQKLGG